MTAPSTSQRIRGLDKTSSVSDFESNGRSFDPSQKFYILQFAYWDSLNLPKWAEVIPIDANNQGHLKDKTWIYLGPRSKFWDKYTGHGLDTEGSPVVTVLPSASVTLTETSAGSPDSNPEPPGLTGH